MRVITCFSIWIFQFIKKYTYLLATTSLFVLVVTRKTKNRRGRVSQGHWSLCYALNRIQFQCQSVYINICFMYVYTYILPYIIWYVYYYVHTRKSVYMLRLKLRYGNSIQRELFALHTP